MRKSRFEDPGKSVPKLKGDAIMMLKEASSSALLYWDGTKFDIYWQSD